VSLSDELRDELAQIAPERRCCRLAELSALFHSSGAWHLRDGSIAVHLDLISSAIARRAFALLRDLGVRSEIRTYPRRSFEQATRYQLHVTVDAKAHAVLREAGVLSSSGAPLEVPPKRVVGRSCCRSAYLRGALLGAGSLSGPRNPHLEIRTGTLEGARFVQDVARRADASLATAERRGHALAYAKGHDAIGAVLAVAGAGTPRSSSKSTRSSRPCAPTRTGWRTPTRRTSSASRAPRTASSRRSAPSASTHCLPSS